MLRLREEFIAAGKVKQFDHLVAFLNRDSDTVRYGGRRADGRFRSRVAHVRFPDAAKIPETSARGGRRNRLDT